MTSFLGSNNPMGASNRLISSKVFNRLEALAFDVPKEWTGAQGASGFQGLFGLIGEVGATGEPGQFGTLLEAVPHGIIGVVASITTAEYTFPDPPGIFNSAVGSGNTSKKISFTIGLAAPHFGNISTIGAGRQFNQIQFVEIEADGTTKYVPTYFS